MVRDGYGQLATTAIKPKFDVREALGARDVKGSRCICRENPHKTDQSFDASRSSVPCCRSFTAKMGKPKGSKNKKASGNPNMKASKDPVADGAVHDAWSLDDDADMAAASAAPAADGPSSPADEVMSSLSWLPAPSGNSRSAVSDENLDILTALRSRDESPDLSFLGPGDFQTVLGLEVPVDDTATEDVSSI